MPLLVVAVGIALLFVLIAYVKLDGFLAFLLVSLGVGVAEGLDVGAVVAAIQRGIGDTLGGLVLILGLGAMLGKLVADSGAAQRITERLVAAFGRSRVQWALVLTGFIVGIPMFYTVGFVVLIPIVYTVAAATGLPLIYVGLPMLASLSVTHGYLPPHPAPTGIAILFGADIGRTLLYGIAVAVPAIAVAGPLLTRVLADVPARPLSGFDAPARVPEAELPSPATSVLTALLPVLLIGGAALAAALAPAGSGLASAAAVVGDPVLAMLASVLVAIVTLGLRRGRTMAEVTAALAEGLRGVTGVMLIIAGAGALKAVLVEGGVSDYVGELLADSTVSPLVLAWSIATAIRVCVGSATVAGLTAAGIAAPLVETTGASPELMVLAVGSGSLMLSHVNDGGFWLFKEYFGLTVSQTLRTWTVMEMAVGVMGLLGVLGLSVVV